MMRKFRLWNPHALFELWMARAFAVMAVLYGLRVLICGRYWSRSEVVVDPVRVWFTGLLMIAVGVYLLALLFGDSPNQQTTSDGTESRRT
jgi:hypothetical protein